MWGEVDLPRDTCSYKKLLPPPSDQVRAADVSALLRSTGGEEKRQSLPLGGAGRRGGAGRGQGGSRAGHLGMGGHFGSALGLGCYWSGPHTPLPYLREVGRVQKAMMSHSNLRVLRRQENKPHHSLLSTPPITPPATFEILPSRF